MVLPSPVARMAPSSELSVLVLGHDSCSLGWDGVGTDNDLLVDLTRLPSPDKWDMAVIRPP